MPSSKRSTSNADSIARPKRRERRRLSGLGSITAFGFAAFALVAALTLFRPGGEATTQAADSSVVDDFGGIEIANDGIDPVEPQVLLASNDSRNSAQVGTSKPQTLAVGTDLSTFKTRVRPFLSTYCTDCHGADTQEASVRVDDMTPIDGRTSGDLWKHVADQIELEAMPPEDSTQPSDKERKAIVDWIRAEIKRAEKAAASTGGKVVLRRLNKSEYAETIRQLLSLHPEVDPAEKLPDDDVYEGFDTVGAVQNVSARLLELYFESAQKSLQVALPSSKPPKPEVGRLEGAALSQDWIDKQLAVKNKAAQLYDASRQYRRSDPKKYERLRKQARKLSQSVKQPDRDAFQIDRDDLGLARVGDGLVVRRVATMKLPRIGFRWKGPGIYRATAVIRGVAGKDGTLPTVNLSVETPFESRSLWSKNLDDEVSAVTVETYLNEPLQFVRIRVLNSGGNPGPDAPGLWIQSLEVQGPLNPWPTPAQQVIFNGRYGDEHARDIIAEFAERAFRQPVEQVRVDTFHDFYQSRRRAGASFEDAVRDAITAILVSPEFLFLVEPKEPGGERLPLDSYEIASRLSYFLWSGPPDAELYELAKSGRLTDEAVLREQIERMLDHERVGRFAENFVGQWLQLRELGGVEPDPKKYPEYNARIEAAMKQESELVFLHTLRNDLPIRTLFDADFTFLNQELASLYGIDRVVGTDMQFVKLKPSDHRGSLLTHASVLTVTSDGVRTSPVKRGTFILEQILGDPPPPPPPDVPPVPEAKGATLKERLKSHRALKACSGCHNKIDPLGFALENFNAIGKYREVEAESKQPIDPSGVLLTGDQFASYEEFLKLLMQRESEIKRNLAEKMLIYALGRPLDFTDDPQIEKIVHEVDTKGGSVSALVTAIATSEAFLSK
ncbi:DUF1592 domain-containing protein [Stratiformator vulcanicus]|uniref:Cytochrome c domain-containing protein n=1 Tax=Stratiformator vulcanicus TaxID=2527980 RepID=A0A517QXZ5_9PLAN|nr:DUF1592 domain-containing protein [Stratiformator vulcanicus]QDT36522.1 hypothetical protein Pan189_08810 [Stratiformator vulcanicus]